MKTMLPTLCAFTLLSLVPAVLSGAVGDPVATADGGPELRVEHDARRRTLTLEYGPVTLPAGVAYGGSLVPVSVPTTLPVDGWLRSFAIELLDARGRPLEALLHHAGLFAPSERAVFGPAMRRVVAFGSETERIRLPGQLGYRVQPVDTLLLLAALYNATPVTHEGVVLRVEMRYADARLDVVHQDVLPLYLDVMPPGDRVYDVPPGESQRSWEWSPAIAGRALAFGGHLHRYGRELTLEDVTTGDTVWVGRASYDESGELVGVSRTIYLRGVRLHPDHVYRITALYRNPTDRIIRGAMGKIGGLFLPDEGERLPPIDRTDAGYRRDLEAMVHHTHEMDHVRAEEQRARGGRR